MTYTQGIYVCNPLKVSSEILSTLTEKARWRSIEAFNNVNKHTGHAGCWLFSASRPANTVRISYYFDRWHYVAVRTLGGGDHFKSDVSDEYF